MPANDERRTSLIFGFTPLSSRSCSESSDSGYIETFSEDEEFHDALDDVDTFGEAPVAETTDWKQARPRSYNGASNSVDFKLPNEEIQGKILERLEHYFSDKNLSKDLFLRGRLARNRDGYVTVKLVTSLKKIKTLTKDWRVVLHCLRDSTTLEVTKDCTKLKRRVPFVLPDDETNNDMFAKFDNEKKFMRKSVIAANIPNGYQSVNGVAELFSVCGVIKSVRMFEAGTELPDYLKQNVPSIYTTTLTGTTAIVDFTDARAAELAVETLNHDRYDWRGLHVSYVKSSDKTTAGVTRAKFAPAVRAEAGGWPLERASDIERANDPFRSFSSVHKKWEARRKSQQSHPLPITANRMLRVRSSEGDCGRSLGTSSPFTSSPSTSGSYDASSSPPDSNGFLPWFLQRRMQHFQQKAELMSSARSSPRTSPMSSAMSSLSSSPVESSWRHDLSLGAHPDVAVIRQPRGPDGTRGFHPRPVVMSA